MLATALTGAVIGVEAHLVRVEADISSGFPGLTLVGLPDSAVRESESRIRAALRNCGFGFRWDRRITINLAPANLRKAGSSFDLATAVGLLATDGLVPRERLAGVLLVGELALDGTLRTVPGVLPMMLMARREGIGAAVVPQGNAAEAAAVSGIAAYGAASLPEAVALACGERPPTSAPQPTRSALPAPPDLADVRGQPAARRALEIAAAGGHNLLLLGPPGSGKTMLARRLPGILPPLSAEESLETTAIHSAWGARLEELISDRPFRSPHHTTSDAALVGGGSVPRPGEVSLAHHGVLFLDEVAEFRRSALEALRQPLEEGFVTISRVRGALRMPARFQLVAAMNPCPCGGWGDAQRGCRCTARQIQTYRARLSGPMLDRIDLVVEVGPVRYADLTGAPGETAAAVATRVARARERQACRASKVGGHGSALNATLGGSQLRQATPLAVDGQTMLAEAMDRMALSARGHDRVLRVARTIADLMGSERITPHHIAEALFFRGSVSSLSSTAERIHNSDHWIPRANRVDEA